MKSYSQAGQDIFVRALLGTAPGTFLDIGCAGDQWSNTLVLEEEGWTGTLVDCDCNAARFRKSPFICDDAAKHKFVLGLAIDYLSLDVDEASARALLNLPLAHTLFRVITIEHDAYRFGNVLRHAERETLAAFGYVLICKDVCCTENNPFEDWWVCKKLAEKATPFISEGKLYTEILKGHL
jgi:hypothetical protein